MSDFPSKISIVLIDQGVALGGEWGGGVLMAFEYAPPGLANLFASIPEIGCALGLCLSSGTVALLTRLPGNAFATYGWRIAFLMR